MIRRLIILLLIVGCEETSQHGCLDSQATNYDASATIDNNSCVYADNYTSCMLSLQCFVVGIAYPIHNQCYTNDYQSELLCSEKADLIMENGDNPFGNGTNCLVIYKFRTAISCADFCLESEYNNDQGETCSY